MAQYDKYKTLVIPANIAKTVATSSLPKLGKIQTYGGPGNEGINLGIWFQERIEDSTIVLPDITLLVTLTGLTAGSTNLGTFSGSILSDNLTIVQAFQELETYLGAGVVTASPISGTGLAGNPITIATGAITTTHIANNTILFSDLAQNGATLGQVPTWNGSAWVATTPSGSGSGDGIYGGSGTVPTTVVATLTDNLTFTTDNASGYFYANVSDLAGSNLLLNFTQGRLRFFDVAGNSEVITNSSGISLTTPTSSRVTITGADVRYAANYVGTYSNRSLVDKEYVDGRFSSTGASTGSILVHNGTGYVSVSPIVETQTGVTGTSITLAATPLSYTSFTLYRNGQYQIVTDDYTLAGNALSLTTALVSTDKITAIYYI